MYDGDENFPESLEITRRLCTMIDGLRAERDGQEWSIKGLTEQMEMMEATYEDNLREKLEERDELRFEINDFCAQFGRLWERRDDGQE